MPSKKVSKAMTDAELEAWESTRDLEAELIESVRQMSEGKTLWLTRPSSRHERRRVFLKPSSPSCLAFPSGRSKAVHCKT